MAFREATFRFLEELEENNVRAWFEEHKDRYESDVREPALAFIRAMRPHLASVTPHFRAEDKKVGGSLMRIHRDVRFSKDKAPYKTNVGIQFRHEAGADVHAPGIYVHIDPHSAFVGVGCWMPEPGALDGIRQRIATDPDGFRAIVEEPSFRASFRRDEHGDALKRAPKGYDPDHPLVEELKRKSHLASAPLSRAEVCSDDLPERVARHLAATAPYLRFLCEAVGAPF